jgi:hypothetical protein
MMRAGLLITLWVIGCGTGAKPPVVSAPPAPADARLESAVRFAWSQKAFAAAKSLVRDCLSRRWVEQFRADNHRLPVIKVVPTPLQTSGSIDPLLLEKMVEMELIGSRRARVISAAEIATDRQERPVLTVPRGSLKPDFVLSVGVAGLGRSRPIVLTTLQLVDVKTNEKIWVKVHRSRCC